MGQKKKGAREQVGSLGTTINPKGKRNKFIHRVPRGKKGNQKKRKKSINKPIQRLAKGLGAIKTRDSEKLKIGRRDRDQKKKTKFEPIQKKIVGVRGFTNRRVGGKIGHKKKKTKKSWGINRGKKYIGHHQRLARKNCCREKKNQGGEKRQKSGENWGRRL